MNCCTGCRWVHAVIHIYNPIVTPNTCNYTPMIIVDMNYLNNFFGMHFECKHLLKYWWLWAWHRGEVLEYLPLCSTDNTIIKPPSGWPDQCSIIKGYTVKHLVEVSHHISITPMVWCPLWWDIPTTWEVGWSTVGKSHHTGGYISLLVTHTIINLIIQ